MKTILAHTARKMRCSAGQLYMMLSKPLFFFCMLIAVLPGILLALLLGWKLLFFPASMPDALRGLFLPVWLTLSCGIPALCAAAILALPGLCGKRYLTVHAPIFTMQLLLGYLWALMVLYRFPPLFCMLSALLCGVSSLLSVKRISGLNSLLGCLTFLFGIWNIFLLFLSAGFY